jgi:SAM-dependent methyltransferase
MKPFNIFSNIKKQDYFSNDLEFISKDNRTLRSLNTITFEQMTKRHRVLFPDTFVKGKSVLDLGCCIGATGFWCLSAGASRYVGVETQKEYAEQGSLLLMKHFPKEKAELLHCSVEDFFEKNHEKFDIVCALGVMYAFVDYYSILKNIANTAKDSIVIESVYHYTQEVGVNFCGVQFKKNQGISMSDDFAYLSGKGTRISPNGLRFLMEDFGFHSEGLVYPEKITQSRDVFNITFPTVESDKYLMIFNRTGEPKTKSLSEDLSTKKEGKRIRW